MNPSDLILIAVIRAAHGIKGEVSADSYTFDDTRFKKLSTVFVKRKNDEQPAEMTLLASRLVPKGVLLTFKEITDRTQAEEYKHAEVLIPASERLPLKDGLAYWDEYPGMIVLDRTSKKEIGTVNELIEMPAGNILSVELKDGTERLITMAGEEIKAVDRDKKIIEVELLEEW